MADQETTATTTTMNVEETTVDSNPYVSKAKSFPLSLIDNEEMNQIIASHEPSVNSAATEDGASMGGQSKVKASFFGNKATGESMLLFTVTKYEDGKAMLVDYVKEHRYVNHESMFNEGPNESVAKALSAIGYAS